MIYFFNSISLKYTTQGPDVSKAKMQISFYNLRKTFFLAKYGFNVFDMWSEILEINVISTLLFV